MDLLGWKLVLIRRSGFKGYFERRKPSITINEMAWNIPESMMRIKDAILRWCESDDQIRMDEALIRW